MTQNMKRMLPKETSITVRLTLHERLKVEEAARKSGMTPTTWVKYMMGLGLLHFMSVPPKS